MTTASLPISGHPHSHEDDAERAVRAAIEAVQAPQNGICAHSAKPETSAGIASGLVVIEDTPKALTQLASGAAPYLAAQLQSQAKAGEVIISEATRKLFGPILPIRKSRGHTYKGGRGFGGGL